MGIGFKHGGAGGGAGLNFRVIGGTEQPTAPRENDIWVNTDTRITGWMFAAAEPENPTEGMVWFATGVTSGVAFNALRKNGITVYPMEAQQYIGGAWVKVTAKSCRTGAWRDWWAGQLYDYGTEYPDITGDLVAYALDFLGDTNKAPTISKNSDSIVITTNATNYSGGLAYWAKRIDLSKYNTLKFNGLCTDTSRAKIVVLSEIKESAVVASGVPKTVADDVEIDISGLSGEYYIGFAVSRGSGGNNSITLNQLILEGNSGSKPVYVNQVPTSTDTDGSIYNGTGYKDNARLSSSGGVSGSAQVGSVVTGFIPYSDLAIVRIKGATWAGLNTADGHYYINAYDSSKAFMAGLAASDGLASTVASYDEATGVTAFDFGKLTTENSIRKAFEQAAFFRLNAKGNGSDLIVTVNQEIT